MRNRYNKPDLDEGFSLQATQVPLQSQISQQAGVESNPYQSVMGNT